MEPADLTHHDCVALIGERALRVTATVSVDGSAAVPLAAFACPGGDVLVPTGSDPTLPRTAVSRPVTVEFTAPGHVAWTINGTGLARRISHHDRPVDDHPHAMLYAFDNGIRILMARLSGHLPSPAIPAQRHTSAPIPLTPAGGIGTHAAGVLLPAATESTKNPGVSPSVTSVGDTPGSSGNR